MKTMCEGRDGQILPKHPPNIVRIARLMRTNTVNDQHHAIYSSPIQIHFKLCASPWPVADTARHRHRHTEYGKRERERKNGFLAGGFVGDIWYKLLFWIQGFRN